MPVTRARAVVDGAFFAAVTVLLFLAYKLPVLGVVGDLFCPVPVLYIGVRHGLRTACLTLAVATLLLLWADPLFALIFVFTFGAPGVALGECLRRRARWGVTLIVGTMVALLLLVPAYALLRSWSGLDPVAEYAGTMDTFERVIGETLRQQAAATPDAEQREKLLDQADRLHGELFLKLKLLLPASVLFGLLLSVGINLLAARWLLRRVGTELPPLAPFRSFRCWDACVWGFIAGLGLLLLEQQHPPLWALGLNLTFLFGSFYLVQGLAVAATAFAHWQTHRFLRIAGLIFLALPLQQVTVFLGVFDTWLDFRARMGPPAAPSPAAPPGPRS